MKKLCDVCHAKMAVWCYMPSTGDYCDDCVRRGCSCNIDPDTGIEDADEQGRFLPCCEYNYAEGGFEDEG